MSARARKTAERAVRAPNSALKGMKHMYRNERKTQDNKITDQPKCSSAPETETTAGEDQNIMYDTIYDRRAWKKNHAHKWGVNNLI